MKIAILMDAPLRQRILSDKTIDALKALGDIRMNETSTITAEIVKDTIRDADIAITSWGNTEMTKEILDCAPNLKLVAHAAGSVKGIVSDELYARGIKVISSACALSSGVSDTALGFTIAAAKNFFQVNDDIANGGWNDHRDHVRELCELTVGVIGCGFAGAHYIELMKNFDVEMLCFDPFMSAEKIEQKGAKKAELEELLRESDIISIHAPSLPSTYHMINAETIGMMKDNVILINTARGSLIDEEALYQAMINGKIQYACLDVTDPEPPAEDMPLRKVTNCIMTPHIAGLANNGQKRIGAHVLREIVRFIAGEALISEVTQEMLASIA